MEEGPGGQRQRGPRELGGGGVPGGQTEGALGVRGAPGVRGWGAWEVGHSQASRSCWGRWRAGGLAEAPLLEVSRAPGSSGRPLCPVLGRGLDWLWPWEEPLDTGRGAAGRKSPRQVVLGGRKPSFSGLPRPGARWPVCGGPIPYDGPPVRLPCVSGPVCGCRFVFELQSVWI